MSGKSSERFTKPGGKQSASKEARPWLGFIDIALSDEQRAIVSEMNFPDESALSFLEELCEDGYKISIVQDKQHKSYIATATGQHADNLNQGYSLSGRGPTVIGAVAALAYKHVQLCDRGVWANFAGSTTTSAWG